MSQPRPVAVIVLAAGEGTRMKSRIPKVLHSLCGRSMLGHALAAAAGLGPQRLVVVAGHGRDEVSAEAARYAPGARVVVQDRLGGTGHAVRMATEALGDLPGIVVVTYADMPLLRAQTLAALVREHAAAGNAVTVLTARVPDPSGYGRIIRDDGGSLAEIVEEADATAAQRAIDEINSGCYAFDGALLADAVKRVATSNAQGQEYLTDVVGILRGDGHLAGTVLAAEAAEIQGVNDRVQLAQAQRACNGRLLEDWMRAGVTIMDPSSTWVDVDVTLAQDAEILPGTHLEGRTDIGPGARIGPDCLLRDTSVGQDATVLYSVCESAEIVEEVDATAAQRAINEINSGCYAFDGALLADAVKRVATSNAQGQEYLTDVVAILRGDGHPVGTVLAADPAEVQGVNDLVQLARVRRAYNERLLETWMRAGVTIVDPAATWIDVDVTLAPDAEILPGTHLEGHTVVGSGARIGPDCLLRDTMVAPDAKVLYAVCES
ncbi:MAG TPA: NTP transferase domain-containing protein, partial [Streptosporangiaceae bacterium]|nr:NTP transferase domain-containing protein [Streptosporangiaceae bacterium]